MLNLQNLLSEQSNRNLFTPEEGTHYDEFLPRFTTPKIPTFQLIQQNQQRQSLMDYENGFVRTFDGFECSTCSYKSKFRSLLLRHMSSHTKEKAFICTFCHEGFTQKSSLNRHFRKHILTNS